MWSDYAHNSVVAIDLLAPRAEFQFEQALHIQYLQVINVDGCGIELNYKCNLEKKRLNSRDIQLHHS